jgi:tryptophan synthase beta subunit
MASSCTVGGGASSISVGFGFTLFVSRQVGGLLVGQEGGDGLHGVADVLAAAEVAGQCSPVLQMRDAVLDADTPPGVRSRCSSS